MGELAGVNPHSTNVLLSATAHELRLPLSHIKGFVSTLRRRDVEWDEDTKQEFLAQIERETDRLTQIIEELMAHSSTDSRRSRQPHHVAKRPDDLIAGGLDRVRGLLSSQSVDIDVSPDLPMVEVDPPAIERVIANLVHNAVKYAQGDSHIRLAARAARGALEVRVEDDGPGIRPEDREQIFRRFYRGPGARLSGRQGNGLGLAICLSIVAAHRGRIWANARPGGGTRFTVVLPLSADSPAVGQIRCWPSRLGSRASGRRRTHA